MAILDIKDQKILLELSRNSRQSATEIAKKCLISREVAEYRIKRLVKQGIIKKFVTLINAEKMGYYVYVVYILLQDFNEQKKNEIIGYLKSNPSIKWLISSFGKYDIMFRMNTRGRDHFEALFNDIYEKYGSNIKSFEAMSGLKKIKSVNSAELFYKPGKYSIPEEPKDQGKDKQKVELTQADIIILKEMSSNSRVSLIELSRKKGLEHLTPEALKYRIKRLQEKKVIMGYSLDIDISKLGYFWHHLLFSIKPLTEKEEKHISTFLRYNNKIRFSEKNIGAWNLSVEVLAKDTADLQKTLFELRNKLSDKLINFEMLLISEEHKNETFPELILDEIPKQDKRNK